MQTGTVMITIEIPTSPTAPTYEEEKRQIQKELYQAVDCYYVEGETKESISCDQ